MTKINLPDWMTMAEAAALLGVKKNRISQLSRDGTLISQRVGVMALISRESAELYRATRKPPGRPPATKPAKGRRKKSG